ncbi:MAG TPA: carboxypeptidase-like regulatory domain-containing protein [Candidatus Polarisedimenticolaceae bacterium]|nr:carboxypeptidase-like regulatory domain-containing protein [Candidatus Polarisedimenticolaceae bacterium]
MRSLKSIAFGAAIIVVLASRASAAAQPADGVGGLVRNAVGTALAGVQIQFLDPDGQTWAHAATDATGRFVVHALPQGHYRVALVKTGYFASLADVDTGVVHWLDVVLHPLPGPGDLLPAPVPPDDAWVLRLPRRSLLRDTDAASLLASSEATAPRPAVLEDLLRMEVEQMFALGAGFGGGGNEPTARGEETRVQVASLLGRRGSIELEGRREAYAAAATRDAASLSLDLAYDTSADTRLAVKAYYLRHDLEAQELIRHQQRSWGYDAAWTKQLGADSRLAVRFDYAGATLALPDEVAAPSQPASAVAASTSYRSAPAAGHELELFLRAQLRDLPNSTLPLTGDSAPDLLGVPGFSLLLRAQGSYAVSAPFSLTYGLGYKQGPATRMHDWIAPSVGGTWSLGRLAARMALSYCAATGSAAERAIEGGDHLGYDAQVDVPLGATVYLRGASRHEPVEFRDGAAVPSAGELPAYVTDGNAGVTENRLALVHEAGGMQTVFELTSGSAAGLLAPVGALAVPLQWLEDGRLHYRGGRIGLHHAPTGTDMSVEYQQVDLSDAARRRSVELRFARELLRFRSDGSWRLLAAVRTPLERSEAADRETVERLSEQVRLGLSVLF